MAESDTQRVEIGDAVDAKDDGLAVDHEVLGAVLHVLDDPRITRRPVIAHPW